MNNRETLAQRTFVAGQRRYRRRIAAGRILLFFAFLAVWEAGADTGLLDDFIFSSPSRALRCFFVMASDGSVFPHLGATLLETVVSFFLVTALGLGGGAGPVGKPDCFRFAGALSGYAEQSSKVCLGSAFNSLAGKQYENHCDSRCVGSCLRVGSDALSGLSFHGSGSGEADLFPGGNEEGCTEKGASAWFHPFDCQQHEGKRRTLPGRSHDRRISGRRQGAGLSDHLRKPGI